VAVRLTQKLADRIDGVDLAPYKVGDTVAFPAHDAHLLIVEGWAELIPERRSTHMPSVERARAADRARRRR
jgi:hypothetical protein